MFCPLCGFENQNGNPNCSNCGAPLFVICPECGASNSVLEERCTQCGHSLSDEFVQDSATEPTPNQSDSQKELTASTAPMPANQTYVTLSDDIELCVENKSKDADVLSPDSVNSEPSGPIGNTDEDTSAEDKHKSKSIILLIIVVSLLTVLGIKNSASSPESDYSKRDDTISDSISDNYGTSFIDELSIIQYAKLTFKQIPDHCQVRESAKSYMTADLYDALLAAWDVPNWSGGAGDNDFLIYSLTGSDPSDEQVIVSIDVDTSSDGTYIVYVWYREYWGATPADNLSSISLSLVNDNGRILLDDFGDNTKKRCKEYILDEVNDFLSGRTVQYMKDDSWFTDDWIADVTQSFSDYISKYKSVIQRIAEEGV